MNSTRTCMWATGGTSPLVGEANEACQWLECC